jgi:N-acetylglucosamine-6-phosphate deacetylase
MYILHARAITPNESIPDSFIRIQNDKIARVETFSDQDTHDSAVIDASGLIAAPGFIDIQLNGGFGLDFTDNPDTIWEVARQLPRYGTTSFLPTVITSPFETVDRAIEILRQGPPPGWKGAIPLGLHLEGPFLNPQKKGAHNPRYLQPPHAEKIPHWSRGNGVWLVTLAPELEGASTVIEMLTHRGVVVSAGHTQATHEQAQAAFAQGVTSGTHLYNAMPALLHRDPGLPGALLTTPGVYFGLIADGIHCHKSMLALAWSVKGRDGLILTTDAMGAMGMPPGRYLLGDFETIVDEVSARLPDGTLAGSILTTDAALQNMMAWFDLSIEEILPALTSTPARMLDISHKGSLTSGADADLVLLTPQGAVMKTFVGGKVLFDSANNPG